MKEIIKDAERFLRQRRHALLNQLQDQAEATAAAEVADRRDLAEEAELIAIQDRLTDREQRELQEIDAAIARIAKGVYGHCERCGKAIGRQRLRAVPEARFCVTCTAAESSLVARAS